MSEQIKNSTLQDGAKSSIKNRSTNQNIFDEISSLLAKVYKEDGEEKTAGDFYGYVIYDNRISVERFKELFRGNKKFISNVLTYAGESGTKLSGTVVEAYVDIPQVSDFLPRPNLNLLLEFIKATRGEGADDVRQYLTRARQEFERFGLDLEETVQPTTAQTKQIEKNIKLKKIYKDFRETLEIITMYPKVYKYTESGEYLGLGVACEVHIPWDDDKDIQTMGYGYFKRSIGGRIASLTQGPQTDIKKIIEEATEKANIA